MSDNKKEYNPLSVGGFAAPCHGALDPELLSERIGGMKQFFDLQRERRRIAAENAKITNHGRVHNMSPGDTWMETARFPLGVYAVLCRQFPGFPNDPDVRNLVLRLYPEYSSKPMVSD